MTRCRVWIAGHDNATIVNATAELVADQVNSGTMDLLVPMITFQHPDEIDKGIEVTIWVSPDHVTKIEPILQDD